MRVAVVFALMCSVATVPAQNAAGQSQTRPSHPFEPTVDSIMRGSDLAGWPPDGVRWSADSSKVYFDWRKPGEDEASTGESWRPLAATS